MAGPATAERESSTASIGVIDARHLALEAHYLLLHGAADRAREVLEPARDDPALLERLDPSGPDIAAQVFYAATHEWASSVDDVVRRRTTLFYRGLANEDTRQSVAQLLSR